MFYGAVSPEPAKLGLLDSVGHEGATIEAFFSYVAAPDKDFGPDLSVLADLIDRGQLRARDRHHRRLEHEADEIPCFRERRLHRQGGLHADGHRASSELR